MILSSAHFEGRLKIGWREDKRPTDWSERIIFPNISYGEPTPAVGGGQKTPEITVEIKRRAS